MLIDRRKALLSLAAGAAATAYRPLSAHSLIQQHDAAAALRRANGEVDWKAVRALFPLAQDWLHFASFLFVSHPKPVRESIDYFRDQIDADPFWVETALLTDEAGRPHSAVKRALADYIGGDPMEIALTSNTTTSLAMAWQGLRIRADQEVVTTEHDHYVHHESIRFAAARSGCGVRYVALYDRGADANVQEIVDRVRRAIRPQTRALGVTWVHSSTGVKLPLEQIAEAVARANRGRAAADRCLLIVDGVHGLGNQDVDVAKTGIDFFATGAHKWLFAPRGTGFLWGKTDAWPELRPTIPNFDPDGLEAWKVWMARGELPPTRASFVSPGGFVAYEHLLAIPAAIELHRTIGRDQVAARIVELNAMFKEGAAGIKGLTMHTPRDPALSAGINCFEIAGHAAEAVTKQLAARKIRTADSPYKTSYARVCAGIMNFPEEVDVVLNELRRIASR